MGIRERCEEVLAETGHHPFGPSSLERRMACPGSLRLELEYPETGSSVYADEGSFAHDVLASCLDLQVGADAMIGRTSGCGRFIWSAEDASAGQRYLDAVMEQVSRGDTQALLIEEKLDLFWLVPGVTGTADAVVMLDDEIQIHDLKWGRGVEVSAENNPQLLAYAHGVRYEVAREVWPLDTTVRLFIHQPRLGSISEWATTVEHVLGKFAGSVDDAWARAKMKDAPLVPGDKQCKFCSAKAECPALQDEVLRSFEAYEEDASVHALADLLPKLDMIEGWAKAIRAKAMAEALAGVEIPGYKLVAGKRGARQWADASAAEAALKGMRLRRDEMYDHKVISPTTAEKLLAETSPRRWAKLQDLITQAEGKPALVPASDKRPAISLAANADEFEKGTDHVH